MAIWVALPSDGLVGGVQHVRLTISVVTVTTEQAFLGLGA